MEVFSLEVYPCAGGADISELRGLRVISQSNATYKVQCLMKRGISKNIRRIGQKEYILKFTGKY
jgi:hypothetical protein